MLSPEPQYVLASDQDRELFDALVPPDHYLRRAAGAIDFERFRSLAAACYHPSLGRWAIEPVLLLKLEFVKYHDRLSDGQVIAQTQVNVAYREFLGLSLKSDLPDSSTLCRFRGRLGAEGFRRVFDDVVAQAREHGLVKDRLRLKDATHVVADVAIPSTIRLVGAIRDRLLKALAAYDPLRVEGERVAAETIRASDAGASPEQRLEMRVGHLREIVAWADVLGEEVRATQPAEEPNPRVLEQTLTLAHKVLADREHPGAGDKLVSLEDSDTRNGNHHGWYCGYLLDVLMDPHSELFTSVNLLPANGDEAADAATLIRQEEEAHGNDIEALSADAALHRGDVLRQLSDPEGLNVEVFVPPVIPPESEGFTPQDFTLDEAGQTLACPAGRQTTRRYRNRHDTGWTYQFSATDCGACPLRTQCFGQSSTRHGRRVNKGDYVAEYQAVRQKAQTPEYEEVRRMHRKVERKLGEIVRHHGGRRARCRGQPRVLIQEVMTAVVVNVRRMAQLLCAGPTPCAVR